MFLQQKGTSITNDKLHLIELLFHTGLTDNEINYAFKLVPQSGLLFFPLSSSSFVIIQF